MERYQRQLLQLAVRCCLLALSASSIAWAGEEFFAAARKGDVAALKEQLDNGVDVNSKWRYDQTALMMAASRGHVEAVKLLLDRGAAVNIKDSFYGTTPLAAAMGFGGPVDEQKKAQIARMLIEKGATDRDRLLTSAARSGEAEVVKAVLPIPGWKPEALTSALMIATAAKHKKVEEMLKAAGATLPPEVKVDPDLLSRYAGSYSGADGMQLKIEVNEGKLRTAVDGQVMVLRAIDQKTFEPEQYPGMQKILFVTSGDSVAGLEVRFGERVIKFTKASAK